MTPDPIPDDLLDKLTRVPLPRDFLRWEGDWTWTEVLFSHTDGTEESEWMWVRSYRERSHCGTDGCCELVYPYMTSCPTCADSGQITEPPRGDALYRHPVTLPCPDCRRSET